jgi:hypothetical protein
MCARRIQTSGGQAGTRARARINPDFTGGDIARWQATNAASGTKRLEKSEVFSTDL